MTRKTVPTRDFYIDPSELLFKPDLSLVSIADEETLYKKLISNSEAIDTMTNVLSTDYFKGIINASLDPNDYGALAVEDVYYCLKGAADYSAAAAACSDMYLRNFLKLKENKYNDYNEIYRTAWHLRDSYGIVPGKSIKNYANYEAYVSGSLDPIYTLVVMLPCEYLWWWIAYQLNNIVKADNLYRFWVDWNYKETPKGAIQMGEYIERNRSLIDEDLALTIFKTALNHELEVFINATKK
ncbi:MAG: hypothetical protein R3Y50_07520 [Rikenellaceae bacterium]